MSHKIERTTPNIPALRGVYEEEALREEQLQPNSTSFSSLDATPLDSQLNKAGGKKQW